MNTPARRLSTALTLVALLALEPVAVLAQAPALGVTVNGAPVTFDQPPVERAGRVFVPLRGVFESLGASVVFENGTINATEGQHRISLQIGQTTATVDGTPQTLDSPPFLSGGRALVPLRFISQALGAAVDFDNASHTVAVTMPVAPAVPAAAAPPPAPPAAPQPELPAMELLRVQPARDASVETGRPELAATFARPVDPDSVRVSVDGRDVTQDSYVNERSFVYDPTFDLPQGSHTVAVSGRTPGNERFVQEWHFETTGGRAANYISGLEPPNGTPARTAFTVSGITKPGAQVSVVATSSQTLANFSETAQGSITANGAADPSGYFEIRLQLPQRSQSVVDVMITSVAPDGDKTTRTLRLNR